MINPYQVRALSTDSRVPHLTYNFHSIILNRDYVNQAIDLQLAVLKNKNKNGEMLYVKSLQGTNERQIGLAEACGVQIGDRIVEGTIIIILTNQNLDFDFDQ